MNILVGDVGGTHCRLAMAHVNGTQVSLSDIRHFRNEAFPGLETILAQYLGHTSPPAVVCLAVAGPTDGRRVRFTNLAWHIDAEALGARLGLTTVRLINDFVAVGWGLNTLADAGAQALAVLQPGQPVEDGVKAAVGAGTGLGVSIAAPCQGLHRPLPTEGGHIGFAPVNAEQDRLLAFLRGLYGRVSVERILSGPGILDLYRFCAQAAGQADPPQPSTPEAIGNAALHGQDAVAVHALQLFVTIYGQVAGDIALLSRAQGGIYLAGGIPPKLLPLLRGPAFLAGFHAKGRFSDWMHTVPVHVILDPHIGLRGAALAAGH
jgi:glucokinase